MDPNSPSVAALSGEYARNVIRSKARKLAMYRGFGPDEGADLEREILARMCSRIEDYDGRVPLNIYIAKLAGWAAGEILAHQKAAKRGGDTRPLSLDAPLRRGTMGGAALGGTVEDGGDRRRGGGLGHEAAHAQRKDKFHQILAGAAPEDAAIAAAWMRRGSELGAATELGISRRQVKSGMERLRKLFEANDLEGI